jgi:plasmid stabilization system protein ParE
VSYNVIIEDEAEEDLKKAARWMAQYSAEKATLWYFEISEAIASLEAFPFRCPLAPESKTHGAEIRHLICGDYRILFIVIDEAVHVLRVRHARQATLKPEDKL